MNSSTDLMATLSDQLQDGFINFTKPGRERLFPANPVLASTARRRAVSAPEEAFEPFYGCEAQAQVSAPVTEDEIKPTKAAREAVGLSLIVAFVLGVGTMWGRIVVQLAVIVSQAEPFLVRNILWTHQ